MPPAGRSVCSRRLPVCDGGYTDITRDKTFLSTGGFATHGSLRDTQAASAAHGPHAFPSSAFPSLIVLEINFFGCDVAEGVVG